MISFEPRATQYSGNDSKLIGKWKCVLISSVAY